MKTLSEETKRTNYSKFVKCLNSYVKASSESIDKLLNDVDFMNATFSASVESGMAYDGSLLELTINKLIPIALKINDIYSEEVKADKETIIRVCLFSQLPKAKIFIKNTNEWEVTKIGLYYTYANYDYALKLGNRVILTLIQCGIDFSESEFEAISAMDRQADDKQINFHANIATIVLKQALELLQNECRLKYKLNKTEYV